MALKQNGRIFLVYYSISKFQTSWTNVGLNSLTELMFTPFSPPESHDVFDSFARPDFSTNGSPVHSDSLGIGAIVRVVRAGVRRPVSTIGPFGLLRLDHFQSSFPQRTGEVGELVSRLFSPWFDRQRFTASAIRIPTTIARGTGRRTCWWQAVICGGLRSVLAQLSANLRATAFMGSRSGPTVIHIARPAMGRFCVLKAEPTSSSGYSVPEPTQRGFPI